MRHVHKIALLGGGRPEIPRFIAGTVALALAGLAVAGCGGADSANSEASKSAQVEDLIERQLTRQLANSRESSLPARVENIGCVAETETKFSCLVKVKGENESGEVRIDKAEVDATCDERQCLWHIVEAIAPEPTERTEDPVGEFAAFAQVSCREVKKALNAGDDAWLERAGWAVAYEAIKDLPNANEKRLVRLGTRSLTLVCRRADNPSYVPYEEAFGLLVAELEG